MPTDEYLTALALAAGTGDRAAFAEFVRCTQADVRRFVAHLTDVHTHRTDVQSVDDLTQETFLRAMGSLPGFVGRSTARTWLLTIARRTVIDRLRHTSTRPRTTGGAEWDTAIEQRRDRHSGDVGEQILVADLLRHLPEERREAFVLTRILGLTYAEAARATGCPVGTVRSRVARARETLAELWQGSDADSADVRAPREIPGTPPSRSTWRGQPPPNPRRPGRAPGPVP